MIKVQLETDLRFFRGERDGDPYWLKELSITRHLLKLRLTGQPFSNTKNTTALLFSDWTDSGKFLGLIGLNNRQFLLFNRKHAKGL